MAQAPPGGPLFLNEDPKVVNEPVANTTDPAAFIAEPTSSKVDAGKHPPGSPSQPPLPERVLRVNMSAQCFRASDEPPEYDSFGKKKGKGKNKRVASATARNTKQSRTRRQTTPSIRVRPRVVTVTLQHSVVPSVRRCGIATENVSGAITRPTRSSAARHPTRRRNATRNNRSSCFHTKISHILFALSIAYLILSSGS